MGFRIVSKCQVGGCDSEDAVPRRYYSPDYQGPCGDSFCYASCDLPACREQSAVLCDKHLKALSQPKKGKR